MELSMEQEFEISAFALLLEKAPLADLIFMAKRLNKSIRQSQRLNENLVTPDSSPFLTVEDELWIHNFGVEVENMGSETLRKEILRLRREDYALRRKYGEILKKSWGSL